MKIKEAEEILAANGETIERCKSRLSAMMAQLENLSERLSAVKNECDSITENDNSELILPSVEQIECLEKEIGMLNEILKLEQIVSIKLESAQAKSVEQLNIQKANMIYKILQEDKSLIPFFKNELAAATLPLDLSDESKNDDIQNKEMAFTRPK